MTALRKYARLEAMGLWRPLPDAQRRDVIVSFGDATLVLSDPKAEQALTHWSLAAVRRVNPGLMPAIYAPSSDPATDTLELDDLAMIDAIETVHGALVRRRPRRGLLRLAVIGATFAGIAALGWFWLPGALVGHTARALPMVARVDVGQTLLGAMARFTGTPCAEPAGLQVLDRLSVHLFGPGGARLVVLRDGVRGTTHLPGRHILIHRRLVEDHDTPEVLAGYLLAERLRAEASDPLVPVLQSAGLRATVRLLTTGSAEAVSLDAEGQAQAILAALPASVDPDALLSRFRAARLPSTPYALEVDPSGQGTLALIEADPARTGGAERLMPDSDWLRLQGICRG